MNSEAISAGGAIEEGSAVLDSLNLAKFSAPQIDTALRLVEQLSAPERGDPVSCRSALQAYARGAGFDDAILAAEALRVRVAALAKWRAGHDPLRQSNAQSVVEAAAVSRLSELADGIGFEPAAFQEFILFIEEIPW
ncbi:hypothetical protein [Sphingobium nicotianae]|uniref:Uncharacterized protein n=1 Tax=Sphingobium nicotianae TaxID=2782607 RepID=A0A9X1ITI7_9SPHN|nr:hypothetical protein [Sphingobium nicotianae]MBT2189405.1 hypothetical protein [Sphingobium nicotianae]